MPAESTLVGVDFTSNPSRRKPITMAHGTLADRTLRLRQIDALHTLADFTTWLRRPRPWLGAFDLPFGLPRAFVDANGLGSTCAEVSGNVHGRCATRMHWRAFIDAWGNPRPPGQRLLHRITDREGVAASTSPLQTRYVPVGFMYYEGLSRLIDAGVTLPGLHAGAPDRIALEGYPRRLAHALVDRRSYKNTDDADRRQTREAIVAGLEAATATPGIALRVDASLRATLVADASGDRLDAVLCLVQAAVAARRPGFGLPEDIDPVEGWIAG